jgi:hypothetical protein
MTAKELARHVVDLVTASGYPGAAVLVLTWEGPDDTMLNLIASNMADPAAVRDVLDHAVRLTREERPYKTESVAPRTPRVKPS